MKRFSKKILNWGLAELGIFLAAFTYSIYRMSAVVYGPPPCEIIETDSISKDNIQESDDFSKKHP